MEHFWADVLKQFFCFGYFPCDDEVLDGDAVALNVSAIVVRTGLLNRTVEGNVLWRRLYEGSLTSVRPSWSI